MQIELTETETAELIQALTKAVNQLTNDEESLEQILWATTNAVAIFRNQLIESTYNQFSNNAELYVLDWPDEPAHREALDIYLQPFSGSPPMFVSAELAAKLPTA